MEETTRKSFWRENRVTLLLIAAVVAGYLYLYTPGDKMPSTEEFDALVSRGTPTLVEFYSNT